MTEKQIVEIVSIKSSENHKKGDEIMQKRTHGLPVVKECEGCPHTVSPYHGVVDYCRRYLNPVHFQRPDGRFMCPGHRLSEVVTGNIGKKRVGQQKQSKRR